MVIAEIANWTSRVDASTVVDIVFFGTLLVACIAGSVRGASGEIARLLALVGGAAVVFFLHKFLMLQFEWNKMLAFSVALMVAILVVLLVNWLSRKIIRILLGQPADAIAGSVMALFGAFLILTILLSGIYIFVPRDVYENVFEDTYAEKITSPLVRHIDGIFEDKR